MKQSLAAGSLLVFGLTVLILLGLTLFESAFVALSIDAERVLTVLLLVVPAAIGAALGVMSIARGEGRRWMAIVGIIVNALFALFFLLLTFFAG